MLINGSDYIGNDNNKYDLFVPMKAINKKNNYNGVMIFLHGGSRFKEDMHYICARYAKMGYITATMHYNEIKFDLIHTSLFSMLDEMRACIAHIKQKLKNDYGFDDTKLELSVSGHSLGGHLSLLYGYSQVNKSPIPVKFIILQAAALDRRLQYQYRLQEGKEPLADIESESIDEGIKNGTLGPIMDEKGILDWYNMYTGKRYDDSKINAMLDDNGHIKYESEEYKKFYTIYQHCMTSYYINKTGDAGENITPLLAEFGGKERNCGVAQYRLIKKLSQRYENKFPIDLVYMRYGEHSLMDSQTENGINAMRDLNIKILEWPKNILKMKIMILII